HSTGKPREHSDWFLRDEAGEFVTDWEYKDALHLDPGNEQWQQYVGKTLKDYVQRYGYDGVFVDLVISTTKYVNLRKNSKAVNPKTGEPYTNSEWKEVNLALLRTVRSYIGEKVPLIINGSRGKEYFQTGYYDFFQFADGMCIEGFMGWNLDPQLPDNFEREEDWKADVDTLADCARRGKIAMVIGNVKQRQGITQEQYERYYRYITASFLLGKGKQHYVTFFPKVVGRPERYAPGENILPKFCSASLGEPRGEYYRAGGIYQRDFEQGKVIVNPSVNKMNVEIDGSWKTVEGDTVVSPISLSAHSGVILIKK
ncbi:MAG: putative glycoside hydrolase, partial [Candidatus Omnitrophota bacterium]